MTDDEQEAGSNKYASPRVVALSSGRFAIYDQFSNEDGLPLDAIVDEVDLPRVLRDLQHDIERRAEIFRNRPIRIKLHPTKVSATRTVTVDQL